MIVAPKSLCYIIAEAGVNHNGSLELAHQLVDAAADAGADAVKFQTFRAERLVTSTVAKARYQVETTGEATSQLSMLKALELDEAAHHDLVKHCHDRSICFLSTPFDRGSLAFLANHLHVPTLKLGSGDLTNGPLLLAAAQTQLPLILSTGMAVLAEVEQALAVLAYGYCARSSQPPSWKAFEAAYISDEGQQALKEKVTLLHCTTEYPTPFDQVHLRTMDTLAIAFGIPVGLSDHTVGISAAIAAVARGATVIEKHFTLDKTMPGPDHLASLEPSELSALVRSVREVEMALGNSVKRPMPAEMGNRLAARRGLVAADAIAQGDVFSEQNLAVKRGGGASAMHYWDWLGKAAEQDYAIDEAIR